MEPKVGAAPTAASLQNSHPRWRYRQNGALGGARSHDLMIKSHLLYQLSYQRINRLQIEPSDAPIRKRYKVIWMSSILNSLARRSAIGSRS
jgi:hypothetical protein